MKIERSVLEKKGRGFSALCQGISCSPLPKGYDKAGLERPSGRVQRVLCSNRKEETVQEPLKLLAIKPRP